MLKIWIKIFYSILFAFEIYLFGICLIKFFNPLQFVKRH